MTRFELPISGVGSNCYTNWVTEPNTDSKFVVDLKRKPLFNLQLQIVP